MEQASRGLLEGLRAQSQSLVHGSAMLGSGDDAGVPAPIHQLDSKSHREGFNSTGHYYFYYYKNNYDIYNLIIKNIFLKV